MPGVGPLHVKCDLQDPLDAGRITGRDHARDAGRQEVPVLKGLNMKWTGAAAIAAAAVLQAGGPVAPARSSAAPPKIVFILADDLGYGELGAYGQKRIRTPRLDRMSSRER